MTVDSATKSAAAKKLRSKRTSQAVKTMAAHALVASRKKKPPRLFGTPAQIQRIAELESVIQILVEAIEPFIGDGKYVDPAWHDEAMIDVEETVGDLRRALEAKTKAEEALKGE